MIANVIPNTELCNQPVITSPLPRSEMTKEKHPCDTHESLRNKTTKVSILLKEINQANQ